MKIQTFALVALACGLPAFCFAQSSPATSTTTTTTPSTAKASGGGSAPYTEGSVWTLTMIKTKTGLDDDYFRQISGTVKPIYDEEKKQKMILDYKILMGDPHNRDEANIIIMVQYANMAALDGLRDKMEPLMEKVMGSVDQRRDLAVKRLDIREILGVRTMREIMLK
ncbi:MAG TPA: hypothetical protein VJ281_04825 [Chthoniobacterales bacterium]|jgi:hypothetical protein|nr:hypothetical protein [Chthoniobacterales bacterium]